MSAARRERRQALVAPSRRTGARDASGTRRAARSVRPTGGCGPWPDGQREWPGRRGSACAAGSRGSWLGVGCSAGKCACSRRRSCDAGPASRTCWRRGRTRWWAGSQRCGRVTGSLADHWPDARRRWPRPLYGTGGRRAGQTRRCPATAVVRGNSARPGSTRPACTRRRVTARHAEEARLAGPGCGWRLKEPAPGG